MKKESTALLSKKALHKTYINHLFPSDEQIANAANNHQLGNYEWQAEKRKSFELGARWARMCMSAELPTDG